MVSLSKRTTKKTHKKNGEEIEKTKEEDIFSDPKALFFFRLCALISGGMGIFVGSVVLFVALNL